MSRFFGLVVVALLLLAGCLGGEPSCETDLECQEVDPELICDFAFSLCVRPCDFLNDDSYRAGCSSSSACRLRNVAEATPVGVCRADVSTQGRGDPCTSNEECVASYVCAGGRCMSLCDPTRYRCDGCVGADGLSRALLLCE